VIREVGEVRAVAGPFATVAAERETTCDVCRLSKACGSALLGALAGRPRATIRALNLAAADVGDRVEVAIDDRTLLRWSVAVYIMPLLCMIGSALFAQELFRSADAMTALAGFAGLSAGFTLLRYLASRIRPGSDPQPIVHRKLRHQHSRGSGENR
jgi:sigma-E factor negative regulatory protein RseC